MENTNQQKIDQALAWYGTLGRRTKQLFGEKYFKGVDRLDDEQILYVYEQSRSIPLGEKYFK